MQLVLIFGITIAIGAVVFALQNNTPVVVTLALWTFEGSLALVLLLSLGLGAFIAGLLSSPSVIRRQWTLARLRTQNADLERRLDAEIRRNREVENELARLAPPEVEEIAKEKPYVGLRALLTGADGKDAGQKPSVTGGEHS